MNDYDNQENTELQTTPQNAPERTPGGQISIFSGGVDINTLLSKAVDLDNVEAIERLTALWERERARVAEDSYNHDMSCLEHECPIIKKTKSVYNRDKELLYKYAPIEEIKRQTKDLIFKYGFSYDVNTEYIDGQIKVIFTVNHRDGHKKEFSLPGPDLSQNKVMNALQARAGSISFMTRKLYCGAFGIVTADDDIDGRVFFEDVPISGNVQDVPNAQGKKKFSFNDAPEENKPIYQGIMALLNAKENRENIFSLAERKEIKETADALLMEKEGLENYYKAIKERSQEKRERLKNAG